MKNIVSVYFFVLYIVLLNSVSKCYICIYPYKKIYITNIKYGNIPPFTNLTAGQRVFSFIYSEYFYTSLC